jgi:hypothetical protein
MSSGQTDGPSPASAAIGPHIDPEVEKQIRSLIEKLASKNSRPTQSSDGLTVVLPGDWDHDAQKIVDEARSQLKRIGKPAISMLLEHLQDERFSRTESSSVEYNVSVGHVCGGIIKSMASAGVGGYKSRLGTDGRGHNCPNYFFANYRNDANYGINLVKWWSDNRHKTVKQMRIDVLKWRIKQEEQIGFPDEESRRHIMDQLTAKLAETEAN